MATASTSQLCTGKAGGVGEYSFAFMRKGASVFYMRKSGLFSR